MKKVFCFFLIAIFFISGCAPNPAIILDNYFSDLDVDGRFTQCYSDVILGMSPYTTSNEIKALYNDLESVSLDDEKSNDILTLVKNAIVHLRNAARFSIMGENDIAQEVSVQAYEEFLQATKEKKQFLKEHGM